MDKRKFLSDFQASISSDSSNTISNNNSHSPFNKETIESNVEFVEEISVDFIPTYLGYFFVALSFSDDTKLINVVLVFCILFFFTFVGSKHFFNPLYYVFGYKLYKVKTSDGVESAIYSQQVISSGQSLKECNIHRI